MAIGCNPIQTIGFIFRDDPKVQPKYPLRPKEGAKKEKTEEITILVLCDQRPGLPALEFAGADRELAENIIRFLPDMAKANKDKLKVVSALDIANYQSKNPGWKQHNPAKIG